MSLHLLKAQSQFDRTSFGTDWPPKDRNVLQWIINIYLLNLIIRIRPNMMFLNKNYQTEKIGTAVIKNLFKFLKLNTVQIKCILKSISRDGLVVSSGYRWT